MEPHIVRAIIRDGRREPIAPKVLRRTITPETAATLTGIMEGVVSTRGTAHPASLDDYQVAGKTGTSHKVVGGHYSSSDYNASFVGFVPSRHPVFTILVVVDSPHGGTYYGGTVAGPIFKKIAQAALQYAGVPPSIDPLPPVLVSADADTLAPPIRSLAPPSLTPIGGLAVMPDVRGSSARDAVRALAAIGLSARLNGSGFVIAQSPAPGAPLDPGTVGVLDLQRSLPESGEDLHP
jgi:membrane peptidoglycan carboxypeptidase